MLDCYCDYDPPEVSSETLPKARKEHQCTECGTVIAVGETYERAFGVWDGIADTYKTCLRCRDLRRWVLGNVPCFCWAYTNMLDDARQCVREAALRAPDETAGLQFGFLRRVHAIRQHARQSRQAHD